MSGIFTEKGNYPPRQDRTCTRCGHVLVDEDECGPYYQVAVTHVIPAGQAHCGSMESPETTLTFMDRAHECDGQPHVLPAATLTDDQVAEAYAWADRVMRTAFRQPGEEGPGQPGSHTEGHERRARG